MSRSLWCKSTLVARSCLQKECQCQSTPLEMTSLRQWTPSSPAWPTADKVSSRTEGLRRAQAWGGNLLTSESMMRSNLSTAMTRRLLYRKCNRSRVSQCLYRSQRMSQRLKIKMQPSKESQRQRMSSNLYRKSRKIQNLLRKRKKQSQLLSSP